MMILRGEDEPVPATISTASTVPADVPSDFHSSVPLVFQSSEPELDSATKNTIPFTSVNAPGLDPAAPAKLSFNWNVPSGVPSLRQGSPDCCRVGVVAPVR